MESYQYHQENISDNLNHLSTLKKLYVDNYVASFLDAGFSNLVKLEKLKFDGGYIGYAGSFRIDTFSNETFKNLQNAPISTLILENYETKHILPFTF